MSFEFSKNPLVDKINKLIDYLAENKKIVGLYLLVLLAFIGLSIGYIFYRSGLQARAYKDFLIALKTFDARIVKTRTSKDLGPNVFLSEKEKWEEVDKVFNNMYLKNRSAGIAPVFLAYRVEALLNLNKLPEAINVQSLLLKKIPSKSALKRYNQIKLALMQIDTGKEENVAKGLNELKKAAYEQGNTSQDEALYRLGEYFWNIKNFKEAANYWNQLVIKFGKTSKYPSVWVDEVKVKLSTISV